LKKRLENSENEHTVIQKQLTNSQSANSEFNKQVERLNLDLEKQLKTTVQFQVITS
jgi:septal ring factor EnvC (AmiA/AmiB activator)